MSRHRPPQDHQEEYERLEEWFEQSLELTKNALAVVNRLDEEKQKDIRALFVILNGADGRDGLITTVSKLREWKEEHQRKCEASSQAETTGKYGVKTSLINLIAAIIGAIIGALAVIWAAKIGK